MTQLLIPPTLLVGIGGTGQLVLEELYNLFCEHPSFEGKPPAMVQFLHLDADEAGKVLKKEDFLPISADLSKIRDNINNLPYLKNWFPMEAAMGLDMSGKGAKQTRFLGRVCFFECIDTIWQTLCTKMADITSVSNQVTSKNFRSAAQVPEIIVVSSICGGTGAGIFLDLAYVLRELGQNYNSAGKPVHTGFFLTSEAFNLPGAMTNLQANTAAAAMEFDYYMQPQHERFQTQYSSLVKIDKAAMEKPFDFAYLINGSGINNHKVSSSVLAHGIFSQIITNLGAKLSSKRDNPKYHQIEVNEQKHTSFSAYGFGSFLFPGQKLQKLFAKRYSAELTRRLLQPVVLSSDGKKAIDTALTKIFHDFPKPGEIPQYLLEEVVESSDLAVDAPFPNFDNDDQVVSEINNWRKRFIMTSPEIKTFENKARNNLQGIMERFLTAAEAEMTQIIGNETLGVRVCLDEFIPRIQRRLNEYASDWRGQVGRLKSEQNKIESEIRRALGEITQNQNALSSILGRLFSNKAIIATLAREISIRQRRLGEVAGTLIRLEKLEPGIGLIISRFETTITTKVERLLSNFKTLTDVDIPSYLEEAVQNLTNEIEKEKFVDRYIVDTQDIQSESWLYNYGLYKAGAPTSQEISDRLKASYTSFLAQLDMGSRWKNYADDLKQFKDVQKKYAEGIFENIRDLKIDEYLQVKATFHNNPNLPFDELKRLMKISKVSTTTTNARGKFDINDFAILGVPDAGSSVFNDQMMNNAFIGTMTSKSIETIVFPQRLGMIQTREAIPVSAIAEVERWVAAYLTKKQSVFLHAHGLTAGNQIDWNRRMLVKTKLDRYGMEATFNFILGLELKMIKTRQICNLEEKVYYLPCTDDTFSKEINLRDDPFASLLELCNDSTKLQVLTTRTQNSTRFQELMKKPEEMVGIFDRFIKNAQDTMTRLDPPTRQALEEIVWFMNRIKNDVENKKGSIFSTGEMQRLFNGVN
ncbi:MAG: tubulin-like doman-containing protein [Candidatus Ozemobacteraceae bacterium]